MKNKLILSMITTLTIVFSSIIINPINALPIIQFEDPINANGSATIKVVDDSGSPIKGAVFGVYNQEGLVDEKESNDQGIITFTTLELGDFTIKQVYAPNDYFLNTTAINFSITANNNQVTLNNITNIKKSVNFEITQQLNNNNAKAGDTLIYTIIIKNTGTIDANDVSVIANTSLHISLNEANSGNINKNIVTFNIDKIKSKQSVTLNIKATAKKVDKQVTIDNIVTVNEITSNKLSSVILANKTTTSKTENDKPVTSIVKHGLDLFPITMQGTTNSNANNYIYSSIVVVILVGGIGTLVYVVKFRNRKPTINK